VAGNVGRVEHGRVDGFVKFGLDSKQLFVGIELIPTRNATFQGACARIRFGGWFAGPVGTRRDQILSITTTTPTVHGGGGADFSIGKGVTGFPAGSATFGLLDQTVQTTGFHLQLRHIFHIQNERTTVDARVFLAGDGFEHVLEPLRFRQMRKRGCRVQNARVRFSRFHGHADALSRECEQKMQVALAERHDVGIVVVVVAVAAGASVGVAGSNVDGSVAGDRRSRSLESRRGARSFTVRSTAAVAAAVAGGTFLAAVAGIAAGFGGGLQGLAPRVGFATTTLSTRGGFRFHTLKTKQAARNKNTTGSK